MRKAFSQTYRQLVSLFFVTILLLVQFPVISLAFEFNSFNQKAGNFVSQTKLPTTLPFSAYSPLTVFSNSTSISVTDRASGANSPNGISSPYPSPITVSGLSGTITNITVTLTGVSLPRPRDIDILLVGPGGQNLMLMSDTGDLTATSNINLTLSDAGATSLPSGSGSTISTGTFKPTDVDGVSANNDTFPSPAPTSITSPAPTGSATLASVFNGTNPNGIWNLYIEDDALGGGTSTISGGWSLDITAASAVASTATALSSSLNPSLTTQNVTFTATVTSSGNPVTGGTVSFTQNGISIAGCSNVAVNASGVATCTANAGTLQEGTRTIAAVYSGTASFGTSSGSLSQVVNSPTIVTGSQFCNNGGITITDNGTASQYPSNITVSNLVGTVSKITVNLNGITFPRVQDIDLLLVGPGNQAFKILSDVGNANSVTGINLTLDDAVASAVPIGTTVTSGTYRPTDSDVVGAPDSFPAPAPATINSPAPTGTATFASVYNGINPNGTFSLYAVDDALGGGNGSISGYCLNFTLNKYSTTTSISSSANPAAQGQSVTFTATVATSGTGIPSGTVQFFDGNTSLGPGTLNGLGQATLTTSSLLAGNHSITAQYLGADIGAGSGGYAPSTTPSALSEDILAPTAASVTISGRVISATGLGIPKAIVTLTDSNGNIRYAVTNPSGFYRFMDLTVGERYILNVNAKNKLFNPQFLVLTRETTGIDFVENTKKIRN